MRNVLHLICFQAGLLSLLSINATAQGHFTFTPNTGSNMTVLIKSDMVAAAGEHGLKTGDEIAAVTAGGLCVGSIVWEGKNIAITVWGDNDLTPKADGAKQGEELSFRVWSAQSQKERTASVTFASGNAVFTIDGIGIISKIDVPPVTSTKSSEVKSDTTPQANTFRRKPTDERQVQTNKFTMADVSGEIIASNDTGAFSTLKHMQVPTPNPTIESDDTGSVGTIVITWPAAGPNVTKYWFEIAADSTMKHALIDSSIKATDTAKSLSGLSAGTYWWRVRSGNANGWNTFSPKEAFIARYAEVTPSPFSFSWQPANRNFAENTITYILPTESKVLFKLCNTSGKMFRKFSENQQAGKHTIPINTKELHKGSYSYTLEAGEFVVKGHFSIEKQGLTISKKMEK